MSRNYSWKKILSSTAMTAAALLGLSTAQANRLIINAPGGVEFPNEFEVDVFYDTSGLAVGQSVTIIEGEFTFDSNYISQFYKANGGTEEVILPRVKFLSGSLEPAAAGGSSSNFTKLSTGAFSTPVVTQDAINLTPAPPIVVPDDAVNTIQFTADFSATPLTNASGVGGIVPIGTLMFDTSLVERTPEVEFPPLFGVFGTETIVFNWTTDPDNPAPPGVPGDPTLPTDTRPTRVTINGSPTNLTTVQNGVTQRFDLECDFELTFDPANSDPILLSVPDIMMLDPIVPDPRVNPDPFAAIAANPDFFDVNEENVNAVFVNASGGDVSFELDTPCPYSIFFDPIIGPADQFVSAFITAMPPSSANNAALPPFGVGDALLTFTVEPNNTPDTRIIRFRVGQDNPESNDPGSMTQDAFVEIIQEGCTFDSVTPPAIALDRDGNSDVPMGSFPQSPQTVVVETTCDFEFDILYLDENGNICVDGSGVPVNPAGIPDWVTNVTVDTTPDMVANGIPVMPAVEVMPGDDFTTLTYVGQPNTGPARSAVIVFYSDNNPGVDGVMTLAGDMVGDKFTPNANLSINGNDTLDFHFITQDDGCEVTVDTSSDDINKAGDSETDPIVNPTPPPAMIPGPPSFEVEVSNALCTTSVTITEVDTGDGIFFDVDGATLAAVPGVTVVSTNGDAVTYAVPYTVDPNVGPARMGDIEVSYTRDVTVPMMGMVTTTHTHTLSQESGCDITLIDPEITNPPVPVGGGVVTFDISISSIDCPVNIRSVSACGFVTLGSVSDTTGFGGASNPPNELGLNANALIMTASLTVDANMAATPRGCVLLITSDCEEDILADLGFPNPDTITEADIDVINEALDMLGMPPLNTFIICQEGDGAVDAFFEEDDDHITPKFREVVFNADFNEGIIVVDVTPDNSEFTITQVPEWVTLLNRDTNAPPVFDSITGPDANGFFTYVATGDQEFAYWVDSSDIGTSRVANLIITPGNTDVVEACRDVFTDDFTSLTIRQSADCLYTINPFENTLEAGDEITTPTVPGAFEVVTNGASDSITGCTWRVSVSSNTPWLRLVDDPIDPELNFSDPNFVGENDAVVLYELDWNPGPARTGTIQVATENGIIVHTVVQESNCSYTLQEQGTMLTDITVPAAGGSVDLEVLAPGLCNWTIIENSNWLEIMFGPGQTASDSGNEVFDVNVDRNTGPARFTTVFLVDPLTNVVAQVTIRQEAGCLVTIDSFAANFPAANVPASAPLTNSILVTAGGSCDWTATETSDWVSLVDPSNGLSTGTSVNGFGIGQVIYVVQPNVGPARTTTITIGALTHTITQASGCAVTVDQDFFAVDAAASTETVNLTLSSQDCEWTAVSNSSWITVVPGSGTGDNSISILIDENLSIARTGSVTVTSDSDSQDTEVIIIEQANGCVVSIADDAMYDQLGGSGTATIAFTDPNNLVCEWSVSSSAPWLTVTSDSNGLGGGFVSYEVAPFQSPIVRQATLTVSTNNGLSTDSITITQMDECQVLLFADQTEFNQEGGTTSIAVDFPNSNDSVCDWTATANVAWIQITGSQNGVGDSELSITVSPFNGPAPRTGTVTVTLPNGATDSVLITQTDLCDVTLSSTDTAFNQAGGSGDILVSFDEVLSSPTANEFCDWTAESSAPWLVIESDSNGDGPGNISFTVSPWNFTAAPAPPKGGPPAAPSRTATITVTLPNGDVDTIDITQSDFCDVSISSNDTSFDQAGGSGDVAVSFSTANNPAGDNEFCDWVAESDSAWLVINSDSNGDGPGSFSFTIEPWNSADGVGGNNPDSRTATITVTLPNGDSETIVITQSDLCDVSIAANNESLNQNGGNGEVTISFAGTAFPAANAEFCDWSASSNAPWLVITSDSNGEGPDVLSYTVEPWQSADGVINGADSRSATITVSLPNGDSDFVTITQTDECDVDVVNNSFSFDQRASDAVIELVFQAGGEFTCDWQATVIAGNQWIELTGDTNGVGEGTISFRVSEYFLGGTRNGTIRISVGNGDFVDVAIAQTDECVVTAVPAAAAFDQSGDDGSFVAEFGPVEGEQIDCPWTVIFVDGNGQQTTVDWVSINGSSEGTGTSNVSYSVGSWFDSPGPGSTRTATIRVLLANGLFDDHVITQTDFCQHTLSASEIRFDSEGGISTFDVNFLTNLNNDTQYECPWIVRVTYLDANGQPLNPQPAQPEDWIQILEGSTEGSGDGLVTFNVEEYAEFGQSRQADICVILDNGFTQCVRIIQEDECELIVTPDKFFFDHNGVLTGPLFDISGNPNGPAGPFDDNTGTAFFGITFIDEDSACDFTVTVGPDSEWINIQEITNEEDEEAQVFFEVDPNIVPGPDSERIGTIIVEGENGQILIVTVCQSRGFQLLEQFELADPALAYPDPENPPFGFGVNNVVIGYTDLSNYTVRQDGQPEAPFFTVYDDQSNDEITISLDVSSDQRGFLSGFATLQLTEGTFDDTDTDLKTIVSEFTPIVVPVTGRIIYRRTSTTSIETPDNNFSGLTDVKYDNQFILEGSTRFGDGKVRITGRESRLELGTFSPGTPTGFDVSVIALASQGTTRAVGRDETARLLGWNPTSANLAFSKNSLTPSDSTLTRYTSDLLILNSAYSVFGQQGNGTMTLNNRFSTNGRAGAYSLTGRFAADPTINVQSTGKHFVTVEDLSEEGLNFQLLQRASTLFPESTSFSNGQVVIRGTNRWTNGLIAPPSN